MRFRVLDDGLWVLDDSFPGTRRYVSDARRANRLADLLHQHRLLRLADHFARSSIKLSRALIFSFYISPDIICVPLWPYYPRLLSQLRACSRNDTHWVYNMRSACILFLSRSTTAPVFS